MEQAMVVAVQPVIDALKYEEKQAFEMNSKEKRLNSLNLLVLLFKLSFSSIKFVTQFFQFMMPPLIKNHICYTPVERNVSFTQTPQLTAHPPISTM